MTITEFETTEAQKFFFGNLTLQAILIHDEPWFIASDVAKALGYRDAYNLTRRLDDDEKGTHSMSTLGGHQEATIISESGLYTAILGSKVPGAKAFKKWVTSEVLPAIRKTGGYSKTQSLEERSLALLSELTAEVQKQKLELETARPKAAAYDDFLGATGLIEMKRAADLLTEAGIVIGRNQLFGKLNELGWIYRSAGAWVPYEDKKRQGLVASKAQTRPDYRSLIPGIRKVADPKIHLTPKGLHRLREIMLPPLDVAA